MTLLWPGSLVPKQHHIMKNFTISFEGLLLILLLLLGIYGARSVMKSSDDRSPGFASPRQEAPAMVMSNAEAEASYDLISD